MASIGAWSDDWRDDGEVVNGKEDPGLADVVNVSVPAPLIA